MIDKIIFWLVFLLPTQLGRHFWLKESYVFGLRVDYLSPTFYFQDFFILSIIVLFLRKNFWQFRQKKYLFFTGLYLIISLFNIYFSLNPLISFFYWLRISELILLGLAIGKYSKTFLDHIQKCLPGIVLFETGLSVFQMIKQGSIGGIFWFLGERSFSVFTPGIARADWLGKVLLRPYGTFSHPNSLAGFTLVSLIVISAKKRLGIVDKISLTAGFTLLFLSFSRTAWLTVFILSFGYLLYNLYKGFRKKRLKFSFKYIAVLGILPLTIFFFTRTTIASSSFLVRQDLAKFALRMIKLSPLLGVGGGNFVIALAQNQPVWEWLYFLQPVHNIFLLVATETGVVGLIVFVAILVLAVQKIFQFSVLNSIYPDRWNLILAIFAVVFTGLFDHYWLTLIQNQLLFTIVLGLSFRFVNDKIEP